MNTTKFVPQSISLNSDLSSATWSMTALSTGTENIVAQSEITLADPDAPVVTAGTYTNRTVIYKKLKLLV